MNKRRFFTFSWLDVWNSYYTRRLGKSSWLAALAIVMMSIQGLVMYEATLIHSNENINRNPTPLMSKPTSMSVTTMSKSMSIPLEKPPDVLPLTAVRTISTISTSGSTGSSSSATIKPCMLIGIIGNANNHIG